MKKIGIFGGTFDPIHHGHLILARETLEQLALDRVLFIPAAHSPHKLRQAPASAALRWEMLLAAIAGESDFAASRLELDRPGPSYSLDTAEQLRAEMSETKFFWLIGEDNLPALQTWRRFTDLERLVQFVVLTRSALGVATDYPVVQRNIDISASAIRNRVARGQSIRYLVPEAVERIIRRAKLYQGATESNPKS